MNIKKLYLLLFCSMLIVGCTDDESFTTNPSACLTFTSDTINFDTVFATIPTATRTFWVHNKENDGIRLTSVRLANGNQRGFRVNVDGTYLGASSGFQVSDLEIRKGDSIRVFVELTSPTLTAEMTDLEDDIIFQQESGVEQRVKLLATAWQATILNNHHLTTDETLSSERPIIIRGGLTVDAGCTLTLTAGTRLYFYSDAGLHVYGKLVSEGTPDHNVVLRGDRLDRMFPYLPYDGVSGQWRGVHIYEGSYDNVIKYTDIHSTMDGIVIESNDPTQRSLTMQMSTVHNCQGHGVKSVNANVVIDNSQLTNTLGDCLHVTGGTVSVNNSTLAQFYPFDSARGFALYFDNTTALSILCRNSIVTGYAADVLQGTRSSEEFAFDYRFENCQLRTPQPEESYAEHFVDVVYEEVEKEGRASFVLIDIDSLRYNFQLSDTALAIDAGNTATALQIDRLGVLRDEHPDLGCFERKKEQ